MDDPKGRKLHFFHGLNSSPNGLKINMLRAHFPELIAPHLPPDPFVRHQQLMPTLTAPAVLVGSSLGGLSALLLARDKTRHLVGLVLIAPAVGFYNAHYRTPPLLKLVQNLIIPPEVPTTILAGEHDEVIPMAAIESLIERSPTPQRIELLLFDDDHRLNTPEAHEALLRAVRLRMA